MEDRTTTEASTPDVSTLLSRRVVAGLVDLSLVALATAVATIATANRVPASRRPDGTIGFAASDEGLLAELDGPLGTGRLLGTTFWAFSTTDVIVIAATAAVVCLVVGVVIPGLTDGRSPGKMLFRLRILTLDGAPPGLIRHLIRTLASAADLMPVVIPGLTGYAFAASNPRRQRIGDRLARTLVIDQRPLATPPPATAPAATPPAVAHSAATPASATRSAPASLRTRRRRVVPIQLRPTPTIGSATLVTTDRTPPRTNTSANTPLNRRQVPPDLVGDVAMSRPRPRHRADTTRTGRIPPVPVPVPQPNGETVDMSETDSASEQPDQPASTGSAPIPVEERSNNPYPKPVRRSREAERDPMLPDFEALTLPESSLSDMPLTNSDLFESLGLTPPPSATEAEDSIQAVATAPAPATLPRLGSSPAPNKRAPIWSEDWDAWIYWDTTLRTWFRHDMETGNWVPMDED